MNLTPNKRLPLLIGAILLLVIFYLNKYQSSSFLPPVSVHAWRQADGASFALNYYNEGMNFFQPTIHNLNADELTSGAGVSEFPLIYYSAALIYKLLGFNEFAIRLINLIIAFFALIYFFKSIYNLNKSYLWSAFITFIPFTSAVYCYYTNNFLPDLTAFHFILLAACHYINYSQSNKKSSIIYLFLFATLATLLKITSASPVIAFLFLLILDLILKKKKSLFNIHVYYWGIASLLFFTVNILWYSFALKYNSDHHTIYFANTIAPIFNHNFHEAKTLLHEIWERWQATYLNKISQYLVIAGYLCSFFYIKKETSIFIYFQILTCGIILYFALWFDKFISHDYYFSPFFPVLILSAYSIYVALKLVIKKRINLIYTGILSLLLIGYPIISSAHIAKNRYKTNDDTFSYTDFREAGRILNSLGYDRNTKVVSINDKTFSLSLYMLDMKGWTSIGGNSSPFATLKLIEKGAQLLVIKGRNNLEQYPLPMLLNKSILHYSDIHIFDISSYENYVSSFDFDTIYCDTESPLPNIGMLKTNIPSILMKSGITQSREESASGIYSVKLNNFYQYGLNTIIPNISYGDTLIISVDKKGNNNDGYLILELDNKFYKKLLLDTELYSESNWNAITRTIIIPPDKNSSEVGLCFYNPSKNSIYLDNISIIKKN